MYKLKFDTGETVSFENEPTDADIEEVVKKLGIKPKSATVPKDSIQPIKKQGNIIERGLEKASNLTFGTFGKTTGGLITQGIASGAKLVGQATGSEKVFGYGEKLEKQLGPQGFEAKPVDIVFQTLELYPGGGKAREFLSKLPGGKQLVSGFTNMIDKIPVNLRAKAVKQFSEALGATTKENKVLTAKVVPELLEKKIAPSNLGKLSTIAEEKISTVGQSIDEFIQTIPEATRMKVKPVLEALENTKKQFIVDGVQIEPQVIKMADELKDVIAQFGEDISPKSLRAVRQIWDKTISKAGGFVGKTLKEGGEIDLKREATSAIREELAKEFPQLAKLSGEYNFWKNVEKITKATLERKSTQGKGLSQVITTVGGAGAGASQGNTLGERVKNAAIGALIGKFAGTFNAPGYKMISANTKNKLAEAIASGNTKNIGFYLTKITSMLKNISD